jgi:protein TonB
MLISKFDLYRTEWLDLVFDDRNKAYGAYNLRQTYASTLVKAMGITFFSIAVLCGAGIILQAAKPIYHHTQVVLPPIVMPPPIKTIKEIEPPAHLKTEKPQPVKPVSTIKDVPPVVVIDIKAEKPVINDKITEAIGTTTNLKGDKGIENTPPVDHTGGGQSGPAIDNTVHDFVGLEAMPEPVGGSAAWSKFLNRNLRYPSAAQEEGLSGRVLLSFIIEKDGHLSNITVDGPAGHGFDEEALRVLKLAKAWKPGMQNGQPVRVKYSIPINFQLNNND